MAPALSPTLKGFLMCWWVRVPSKPPTPMLLPACPSLVLHEILIKGGTFDPSVTYLVSTMPNPQLALHAPCDKHQMDPSSKNPLRPTPHRGL